MRYDPVDGGWMGVWWLLELNLARARVIGDQQRMAVFAAGAKGALIRTTRGREN